ncbi:hypothetical protein EXU57_24540 [Segetibacter sp. 3557_3]|uniref:hypothetical protein n=1 Tax=Segetibacter sp. 3557_3 TaxID=2547429 RepID=UPI001058707A|nr:hypothetical protein [Segetibacter sp. 3557_3]TDH18044.1 hypothetical protein EXU57_24540 [Segetibacter sp. 3557_3]
MNKAKTWTVGTLSSIILHWITSIVNNARRMSATSLVTRFENLSLKRKFIFLAAFVFTSAALSSHLVVASLTHKSPSILQELTNSSVLPLLSGNQKDPGSNEVQKRNIPDSSKSMSGNTGNNGDGIRPNR